MAEVFEVRGVPIVGVDAPHPWLVDEFETGLLEQLSGLYLAPAPAPRPRALPADLAGRDLDPPEQGFDDRDFPPGA